MDLRVLVDFDNISSTDQNRGLIYIVDKIVSQLPYNEIGQYRRLIFRLYGGWYEQNNITRKAQMLSAEVQRDFPKRSALVHPTTGAMHYLISNIEMAYSMIMNPSRHLLATYRRREIPKGLYCLHPNQLGCSDPNCPTKHVFDFINGGRCLSARCTIRSSDIIHKGQQKLVDTMLVSDLIHLAVAGAPIIGIVSSDDDFWPGIETAVAMGSTIIHLHTRNRNTPIYYCGHITSNYYQCKI